MYFFSAHFAIFVLITLIVYYIPLFRRLQVPILLIASVAFYAIDQLMFLPLLLVAALGTYAFLHYAQRGWRLMLGLGVAFNLLLLGFFKYKLLFLGSTAHPITLQHPHLTALLLLPIPVGISFFVFHSISLLADYGKPRANRVDTSFRNIVLYIIFFPQLVSGPITRAAGFLPQLKAKYWKDVWVVTALRWIINGSFMKLFVADNIGQLTVSMSPGHFDHLGSVDRLLLLFMYSLQIYADFFGYSAIAIGLALLFGYRLPINFNRPYNAESFAEFWRRWHISLSNWLRDYLYFSLPGLRSKWKICAYANLFVTMLLGGLWHGAGMNYMLWGGLHGLYVVVERFVTSQFHRPGRSAVLRPVKVLVVFFFVSMAWILFRLPTFADVAGYMTGISLRNRAMAMPLSTYAMCGVLAVPVCLQHWCSGIRKMEWWPWVEPVVCGLMVYLAVFQAGPRAPFIYFRF